MCGTTAVWPWLSGAGWLTAGFSAMVMVRLPCAMATVETRTSLPMTMMPEISSMTILAGWSVSTTQLLDVGQKVDDVAVEVRRQGDRDGGGVFGDGGRRAR